MSIHTANISNIVEVYKLVCVLTFTASSWFRQLYPSHRACIKKWKRRKFSHWPWGPARGSSSLWPLSRREYKTHWDSIPVCQQSW